MRQLNNNLFKIDDIMRLKQNPKAKIFNKPEKFDSRCNKNHNPDQLQHSSPKYQAQSNF